MTMYTTSTGWEYSNIHSWNSTMASPWLIYLNRRVRISCRTNVMLASCKPHPTNRSATDENRVWHWELVQISETEKWALPEWESGSLLDWKKTSGQNRSKSTHSRCCLFEGAPEWFDELINGQWKARGMDYLSIIDGNATLPIHCTFKEFQQYHLKLHSFRLGLGNIWKRVENVKYAKILDECHE